MKIKICGHDYKIVFGKKEIENNIRIRGEIHYFDQIIFLDNDLPKCALKITLLHEILHGIFDTLGYDKERDNEKLVRMLSIHLVYFMKDFEEIVGE